MIRFWLAAVVVVFGASLGGVDASAGEDKGTIGITCHSPDGRAYEHRPDLKGKDAERAELEFRACVKRVVERWSDLEISSNLLMLEKTMDQRDAGVDTFMIEGYGTYRNVVEEVKVERKKSADKKKIKPRTGIKLKGDAGTP